MITVYHNEECSKSRTALQILQEKCITYNLRNYLQDPLSVEEFQALLKKLNIKAIDLIRKKEQVYIDKFEGKHLNNDEWIEVLIEYPDLMERPIVVNNNQAVVARPPERVLEILSE